MSSMEFGESNNTSIEERQIPSIVDTITKEEIENFQPVYKRYYDSRYCTTFTTPTQNLDTCIRIHSNKVSLVYLSPKHSIFQKKQTIKQLNFQITAKLNRLQNVTTGKGKRGAQFLSPESILCFIETEDGDIYTVRSGIYGKLLEINEAIIKDPNIVIKNIYDVGFIAIIMQDLRKCADNMNLLIEEHDYNKDVVEPEVKNNVKDVEL